MRRAPRGSSCVASRAREARRRRGYPRRAWSARASCAGKVETTWRTRGARDSSTVSFVRTMTWAHAVANSTFGVTRLARAPHSYEHARRDGTRRTRVLVPRNDALDACARGVRRGASGVFRVRARRRASHPLGGGQVRRRGAPVDASARARRARGGPEHLLPHGLVRPRRWRRSPARRVRLGPSHPRGARASSFAPPTIAPPRPISIRWRVPASLLGARGS